ncbi:hypothetical protein ABIE85_008221 [Bradyrhizobium diazoefficiens]|jgi:hypothetical protein|uniref:hypothetical protein n=1 Tax=Bradyrhizobium TaxID=374 RepID=UPI00272BD6DE|nr:hypothetical protein [Bradyrhizobium diazoefficiens]WLA58386.1 hypothetical protein QIH81_06935 [Bradyrhizobium diazoefficiens]
MAQLNVNLSDVNEKDAEGGGGVIIPRDRYLLNIVEGEVKRNSKNTGDLFEYKAEVVEGDSRIRTSPRRRSVRLSWPRSPKRPASARPT